MTYPGLDNLHYQRYVPLDSDLVLYVVGSSPEVVEHDPRDGESANGHVHPGIHLVHLAEMGRDGRNRGSSCDRATGAASSDPNRVAVVLACDDHYVVDFELFGPAHTLVTA